MGVPLMILCFLNLECIKYFRCFKYSCGGHKMVISKKLLEETQMYNIYIDQDIIRCDLNFRSELFNDNGFDFI